MYYLGPGNYFYYENGLSYDILEQEAANVNLENASYQLVENFEPETRASSKPDPYETTTDTNGYTVVNKADYFKKLSNFPNNWFGECGLVGLSILLSYYDTFYNDNFIPNDKTYTARYYKKASRSGDGGYTLDYTQTESLIEKSKTVYKNTTNYSYKDWSTMPGTTYAMRDYLFDKYMHNFWGMGWDDLGYPMLDGELKSTFIDYVNANCSSLKNDIEYRSGCLFNTHKKPTEYINEGLPTCLVLQKYDSSVGTGKSHVVVAYGHKDGKFLAHFGWWPGRTDRASVVLNSATIYGYFTIKYKGAHVHSRNVTMTNIGRTYGICGCGYVVEI